MRTDRKLLAALSVASLVVAFAIPGQLAFAIGFVACLVAPIVLALPRGREVRLRSKRVFITRRAKPGKGDLVLRALGVLTAVGYAMSYAALDGPTARAAFYYPLVALLLATITNGIVHVTHPEQFYEHVLLERMMLTIRNHLGTYVVRYDDIQALEEEPHALTIRTGTDQHVVPVVAGAVGALASAIRQAKADFARGVSGEQRGPRELRRAPGMNAREWIARLDALAAASTSRGYRGAELEEGELLSILQREDEDPNARAGAARLLASSKGEAVRARVAELAEEIADVGARARVRVALQADPEQAAAETEALELEELRADG